MNNLSRFALTKKLDAGVAIIIALIMTGCATLSRVPISTSLPLVHTQDLILDAHVFPEGWIVDPCAPESACKRQYRESESYRTIGRIGIAGHVLQQVFRLDSEEAAQAKFRVYREVDFRPRQPPNRQFLPPSEITYHSLLADEYYLGCGVDVVPACRAIFRYGNYFVYFYFDIDDGSGEGLKIHQVEPVLRAMDARAAAVLGIPLPTKSP